MLKSPQRDSSTSHTDYARIYADIAASIQGERVFIANAANCAAVLYQSLSDINWVGFYLLKGPDLVLGRFQGKPARVRIGHGRGICSTAFIQKRTLIVPDVRQFPGHSSSDTAVHSELVVPLIQRGMPIGVLDLDSPKLNRFSEADAIGLESIVYLLLQGSDFPA